MGCSKLQRISISAFITLEHTLFLCGAVLKHFNYLAEKRERSMPQVEVLLPFRSKKPQNKQVSSKHVQIVFFSDLAWCSMGTFPVYKCNAQTKRQPCAVPNSKHGSARAFQQSRWNIFNMVKTKGFFHNFVLGSSWDIFDGAIQKIISFRETPGMGNFSQNSYTLAKFTNRWRQKLTIGNSGQFFLGTLVAPPLNVGHLRFGGGRCHCVFAQMFSVLHQSVTCTFWHKNIFRLHFKTLYRHMWNKIVNTCIPLIH